METELPILLSILFVAIVILLLICWHKQRKHQKRKQNAQQESGVQFTSLQDIIDDGTTQTHHIPRT